MISAEIPNLLFSILTVVGQIIVAIALVVLVLSWKRKKIHRLLEFDGRHAVLFAFIVALISMIGSLSYSELVGYEPCKLCWFQRILMYPQVAILGIALLKRDKNAQDYCMTLSVLGMLIAAYHYMLQIGVAPATSCSAVGASISCSQVFVMQFGYITIPMMSLTAFSMIFLFMAGLKLHKKLVNLNALEK
jgi:hypothetical protein